MGMTLHIYANTKAANGAFGASALKGKRNAFHRTIEGPDGKLAKFTVVTGQQDVERLRGANVTEIFWHYEPPAELAQYVQAILHRAKVMN